MDILAIPSWGALSAAAVVIGMLITIGINIGNIRSRLAKNAEEIDKLVRRADIAQQTAVTAQKAITDMRVEMAQQYASNNALLKLEEGIGEQIGGLRSEIRALGDRMDRVLELALDKSANHSGGAR